MFSTLHRVNKSASVFALCCPTRPGLSAWTLRSWAEAILRTRVSIPISPWGQTHPRGHGLRAYQGGPGTMPFSESCEGFSLQPSLLFLELCPPCLSIVIAVFHSSLPHQYAPTAFMLDACPVSVGTLSPLWTWHIFSFHSTSNSPDIWLQALHVVIFPSLLCVLTCGWQPWDFPEIVLFLVASDMPCTHW